MEKIVLHTPSLEGTVYIGEGAAERLPDSCADRKILR